MQHAHTPQITTGRRAGKSQLRAFVLTLQLPPTHKGKADDPAVLIQAEDALIGSWISG